MRGASLVYVGMGCTIIALLLLPAASALSVVPDELTRTVRQGQTILFHLEGNANETLTLSTDHIGPQGTAITVTLGQIQLDANGTVDFPLRIVGDLAAVGRWQLHVANATLEAKTFYEVDWDPLFLLERESENLARQEAFWLEIRDFVFFGIVALILTWVLMRLWHWWEHNRPTFLLQTLARKMSRLRDVVSVTEMGLQFADGDPVIWNRAMFAQQRTIARRKERALRETVERADGLLRQREEALKRAETYRQRVLVDNPGDPLVMEGVDVMDFLDAEKMRAKGLITEEDFAPDRDEEGP